MESISLEDFENSKSPSPSSLPLSGPTDLDKANIGEQQGPRDLHPT
jgi:hypothetical protein